MSMQPTLHRLLALRERLPLPCGLLRGMAIVAALFALMVIVGHGCYPDGVIR